MLLPKKCNNLISSKVTFGLRGSGSFSYPAKFPCALWTTWTQCLPPPGNLNDMPASY